MHLLKSNECLFWFFCGGQRKSPGQFEARVYSFFQQVAHVQMGLKKFIVHFQIHWEIILYYWHYDRIKHLGFFFFLV